MTPKKLFCPLCCKSVGRPDQTCLYAVCPAPPITLGCGRDKANSIVLCFSSAFRYGYWRTSKYSSRLFSDTNLKQIANRSIKTLSPRAVNVATYLVNNTPIDGSQCSLINLLHQDPSIRGVVYQVSSYINSPLTSKCLYAPIHIRFVSKTKNAKNNILSEF